MYIIMQIGHFFLNHHNSILLHDDQTALVKLILVWPKRKIIVRWAKNPHLTEHQAIHF